MEKKPTRSAVLANDGYRPLTEGYQPGSQVIQKGFTPAPAQQPPPPRGGSSAARPGATAATKPKG